MTDPLDQFVEQLQNQIYEETRAEFGETVYNRWRNPKYMGRMDLPDGYGKIKGDCGDTMEIFLKFKDDRVTAAAFMTDGCGPSQVCGSFAAELAIGKNPEELKAISGDVILKVIGGLPEENEHCAYIAAETLHQALRQHLDQKIKTTPAGNQP
ncbi:MAG: iron-sulfur cluster assembly scaffold protein [Thermodesulfobacteriota bacterium]